MDTSRRRFLKTLTVTGSALALAPVLAHAEDPAKTPASPDTPWTVIGKAASFAAGHTQVVTQGGKPVAVTHAPDGKFSALSAVCTHRGCTVDWADDTKELVCPCHRGRFDLTGKVLGGPPRRPLPMYATRVNKDGTLSVQIPA